MSKREYIKQNRKEIDANIRRMVPNIGTLNDDDRAEWIMNDEYLYNCACGALGRTL